MIDNQTLGYFIARIQLFLVKIGIDPARLRFRQHMSNEMAHYAADCWDAEILTSFGWIECVGCADRSAYDLTVHAAKTKQKMVVQQNLKESRVETRNVVLLEKKVFGPMFKKDAKVVEEAIMAIDDAGLTALAKELLETQYVALCVCERADDGSGRRSFAVRTDRTTRSRATCSRSPRQISTSPVRYLLLL